MKEVYDFCKKKRGFIIFVFKNNLASSYLQKYNILCFVFNSFLLVTRTSHLNEIHTWDLTKTTPFQIVFQINTATQR